ncbi:hypothetical protein [Occultella gossypii]|uniref:Uncharacterized protein n=1 Tax=Occultella gossypii TaxID=2800820 RepID=A0ABS7S8U5_9MICO|nr:hypothetical protein [Occultella gossypii]MBZ2195701.1 hypothetical protein [Occultella gossypii]
MRAVEVAAQPGGAWRAWAVGRRAHVDDVLARAQAAGAARADLHGALWGIGVMLDGVATAGLPAGRFDALAEEVLARAAARVSAHRWHPHDPTTAVLLDWVPRLAPALGPEPAAALTDLITAVTRLRGTVDVVRWRDLVGVAMAGATDPTHLRGAVTVAAWRCGAVGWRAAALTVAADLPEHVLGGAARLRQGGSAAAPWEAPVGPAADGGARSVLARNAQDPWWWPGLTGPWRIGGFRGFGGPWVRIPELLGGDGLRWWVRTESAPTDGAAGADDIEPADSHGDVPPYRYWEVRADIHGSRAVPRPAPAGGDRPAWAAPSPSGAVAVRAHEHSYYLHVTRR